MLFKIVMNVKIVIIVKSVKIIILWLIIIQMFVLMLQKLN